MSVSTLVSVGALSIQVTDRTTDTCTSMQGCVELVQGTSIEAYMEFKGIKGYHNAVSHCMEMMAQVLRTTIL